MLKTLMFTSLVLISLQSKADLNETYENRSDFLNQRDSSNYKIKVVESNTRYSQLRFTIVDKGNNPISAMIILNDEKKKPISGVSINDDGKILYYLWSNNARYITVTNIGWGNIVIPIEKVQNKIVDVEVQLYSTKTIN